MIPTSTNVAFEVKPRVAVGVEAVAVFVTQGSKDGGPAAAMLGEDERQAVERLLRSGVARGKAKEVHLDLVDAPSRLEPPTTEYRRVLTVGLGPAAKVSAEAVRQAAGALARGARRHKLHDLVVVLPALDGAGSADAATPGAGGPAGFSAGAAAEAVAAGFLLASFDYDEYKGAASKSRRAEEGDDDAPRAAARRTVTLLAPADQQAAVKAGVERGRASADGQNFCRTIASRPGNDINPPTLADVTAAMAREVGLDCRVLDEKQMRKLGMGGILAVGAGSVAPPRLIVLEHRGGGGAPKKSAPKGSGVKAGAAAASKRAKGGAAPLLVVGKAITFDTGGISIKPAEKMQRMIFDKCGGMAVLGFMYAVARLNLPAHVVGILSSAENTLGERAYRPGDILRMYNGVTVEVTNTDAEGRLVLGDALAWGIETFKPAAVIDLATLTGGVVVALGHTMAGVMSNNDALVAELQKAGESAGEKMWRLPVGDDQRDQIKSDFADVVNSAGRPAHPLQGAAFLSHFVPRDGSVPWAHLDIAGVADTERELPYYAKGATGWGVRTLLAWAEGRVRGNAE